MGLGVLLGGVCGLGGWWEGWIAACGLERLSDRQIIEIVTSILIENGIRLSAF